MEQINYNLLRNLDEKYGLLKVPGSLFNYWNPEHFAYGLSPDRFILNSKTLFSISYENLGMKIT